MFQRDYILRLIEMMGDLMRRVAQLMDELDRLKLLDDKCREHCGMPFKALEGLNAESLEDMLSPVPRFIASELLWMRAEGARWDERDELTLKSLRLLASLQEEGPLCQARLERLAEMKERVAPLLTAQDLMACALFCSQGEGYDQMEDALFQALALAAGEERAAVAARGAALLRSAARADHQALILCRMTAQELEEAARELTRRGTPPE